MKRAKWAVPAVALVLGGGAAAAFAPAGDEQGSRVVRARVPQAWEIVTGGGRIGVAVRDVEEADVKESKLPALSGALVEDVTADGPAAKAGIRTGDVIVEFDGERVRGVRHLTRLVQETPDGRSVPAAIVRGGQRTTVTVEPANRSTAFEARFPGLERLGREFRYTVPRTSPPSVWAFEGLTGRGAGRLGITVEPMSSQLAEYFGTKEGVLVASVRDGSAAAKAGLKAGDVITAVNDTTVDDPADVRTAINQLEDGAAFTLAIVRDKKPLTLKGTLERIERRSRRWTSMI